MSGSLDQVSEALAAVLVPGQRANLEREGDQIWINLDNTKTLRGIRIGACMGCDDCLKEGVQHLQFTPYTLKRKP